VSGDPSTSPIPTASVIEEVIELRRHFHRHPEISFGEHDTSKYIGERLQPLGEELKL
jgi:metal-dependent amidase/aminoacylase/carboxypeptidase family protein